MCHNGKKEYVILNGLFLKDKLVNGGDLRLRQENTETG